MKKLEESIVVNSYDEAGPHKVDLKKVANYETYAGIDFGKDDFTVICLVKCKHGIISIIKTWREFRGIKARDNKNTTST